MRKTPEQIIREHHQALGRKGGRAKFAKMTKEEIHDNAVKGGHARAKKARERAMEAEMQEVDIEI